MITWEVEMTFLSCPREGTGTCVTASPEQQAHVLLIDPEVGRWQADTLETPGCEVHQYRIRA